MITSTTDKANLGIHWTPTKRIFHTLSNDALKTILRYLHIPEIVRLSLVNHSFWYRQYSIHIWEYQFLYSSLTSKAPWKHSLHAIVTKHWSSVLNGSQPTASLVQKIDQTWQRIIQLHYMHLQPIGYIGLKENQQIATPIVTVPGGKTAWVREDGTIFVWHPDAPREQIIIPSKHTAMVITLTSLPDGRLAVGYEDGKIYILDPERPKQKPLIFDDQSDPIDHLVALPTGKLISVSCNDDEGDTILIRNLAAPRENIQTIRMDRPANRITKVIELPDGCFAAGFQDGNINVFSTIPGTNPTTLLGHTDPIDHLVLLSDKRLVSVSYHPERGDTVLVWNFNNLSEPAHILQAQRPWNILKTTNIPHGSLALGGYKGRITLWNANGSMTVLKEHKGRILSLLATSDRQLIAASRNALRIWNLAKLGKEDPITVQLGRERITELIELPNQRFLSKSTDNILKIWKRTDEEFVKQALLKPFVTIPIARNFPKHKRKKDGTQNRTAALV